MHVFLVSEKNMITTFYRLFTTTVFIRLSKIKQTPRLIERMWRQFEDNEKNPRATL